MPRPARAARPFRIALPAALGVSFAAAVAASTLTDYLLDDGISNITLGPPGSFEDFGDIDVLWGNYYETAAPREVVRTVSFGLGSLSADPTVTVWVFDDPDDDGDPTNAIPLRSVSVIGEELGFDFNVVDIPPTAVEGGFFIAIGHLAELTYPSPGFPDYPSPVRFDPDGPADRSWFFYDDDIPEEDLASSGFVSRMDGPFVPIQGAHAVRATTSLPADVDGDGSTGFSDLLLVLGDWGACPDCPSDVDGSGAVDFEDLLEVLTSWGDCR